ncbi:MAG: hypothetical protein E7047_04840 [Lentisphaerae bacterium]|nr:hypothetical protein [Lentisphaerota bacterium]
MHFSLNGSDWLANYYLPEPQRRIASQTGGIDGMLMDSSRTAGLMTTETPEDLMRVTVPGCDRTFLLENDEIDDPYFGRNTERSRWSEKAEWFLRKEFVLPPDWAEKNQRTELVFHSAGYKAVIFLNSVHLGWHVGMFSPWRIDVTDAIKPGEKNILTLIFDPAPQASPNHFWNKDAEFAQYHHCQMSFGWDWARALVPTGIFDDVELVGTGVMRIKDAYFRTNKNHAAVDIEIGALEDTEGTVKLELQPLNHNGPGHSAEIKVQGKGGEISCFTYEFDLDDARYWYPNGAGEQNLYQLKLSLPGDEYTTQVGFRDLKMVRNFRSPEEAYPLTFEINGQRIFTRGGNWVPIDMMFSRIKAEDYERQVRLAKEANFNLFRVWGGGLIEKKAFYEACDRHGILVWQEFPHACSSYPADNKYIAMKKREAEAALRKTRNHCSMAMYCGGNEFQYYGELYDSPLYAMYRDMVNTMAPGMPYHISSPDLSRVGERDHGPWCFMEHKFWNDHHRMLASELGCNGWAELESIDRFIPQNSPCPDGQAWRYHFTYNNASRPLQPMVDMFAPEKGNRRQYSQCTMFCQADQLSYVMAHYRKKFPVSSGCYVWQYNESYPTNSFSIIDFYSMPKIAYYALARSNQADILFAEDESWRLQDESIRTRLYLVSDYGTPEKCTAEFALYDITGSELLKKSYPATFPAGTHVLDEINAKLAHAPAQGVVIGRLTIRTPEKTIFYNERLYGAPDLTRALHLDAVELIAKSQIEPLDGETLLTVSITNPTQTAALNVRTRLSGIDFKQVYWLNNYQHILPGETVNFTARITGAVTAVPAVEVYGWNHPEKVF